MDTTNLSTDAELKSDAEGIISLDNPETTAALNEYYEMKAHPERYKRYSSFKAVMEDLLDE